MIVHIDRNVRSGTKGGKMSICTRLFCGSRVHSAIKGGRVPETDDFGCQKTTFSGTFHPKKSVCTRLTFLLFSRIMESVN